MASILPFSSGYSFSLSSKLGWLVTNGFSTSEKRSAAMDAPCAGLTHVYLCHSEGNLQPNFGGIALLPPGGELSDRPA
jgi:hypothetical protein